MANTGVTKLQLQTHFPIYLEAWAFPGTLPAKPHENTDQREREKAAHFMRAAALLYKFKT